MSRVKSFAKFVESNIVLVLGIPLIVGVHWGWYKLQQNPALVKEEERKDVPIIIGWRKLQDYVREEITSFTKPKEEKPAEEKSS